MNNQLQTSDTSVITSLTSAEIDTQISTARKYPRSIAQFQQKALTLATHNVEVAMSCNYSIPRGGKKISGPSVRLAEIAVNAYGNCRVYSRVIAIEHGSIIAEAGAVDLESNSLVKVEVRRKILDKYGKRFTEDMINVTANAACAIAFRNSVFKMIPLSYVKEISDAAKQVAIGNAATIGDRSAMMVKAFDEMGVTESQLLKKIEKEKMTEISLRDIENLQGIYTAIRDGDLSIEEAFLEKKKDATPPKKAKEVKPEKVAVQEELIDPIQTESQAEATKKLKEKLKGGK